MSRELGRRARAALLADAILDASGLDASGLDGLDPDATGDLGLLADTLADPLTWAAPPAELEELVVRAVLAAEITGEITGPAVTSIAPIATTRRRDTSRRVRQLVLMPAAAAIVAISLGIGVLATRHHRRPAFEAQLAATALAPTAHGAADMYHSNAGFRVELDATGLAKLPDGEYYEAWLRNEAGTSVPIGTFSSSAGRVMLWSGVSPKDFPAFSVTIESTDDNQRSSGRRVLGGEIHTP